MHPDQAEAPGQASTRAETGTRLQPGPPRGGTQAGDVVDLSVIICTWNRSQLLADALASVEGCELPPGVSWEVLVVDNNSTDDTRAVCANFVQRNPERHRYLFEPCQGKSFALNTAVANARGRILAFTDDDVTVDKEWLTETLKIFASYACIGVGGKIVDVWRSQKPNWLSFDGPYKLMSAIVRYDLGPEPCELRTPPYGANLALRREAFERYGVFRGDLGLTGESRIGAEDTELGWRMLRAGEKLVYAPRAIVYHPVAEERVSRRYFERWYYSFGKSAARVERAPADAIRYFGIPRYMVRQCLPDLLQWIVSRSAQRRFFYKLQVIIALGWMLEERRLWYRERN